MRENVFDFLFKMTETSVTKILNSTNLESNEYLILCTEFLDYRIKILILRNNNDPLLGEVTISELWKNAKDTFPENEEEFTKQTREALSGKATDYEFYLEKDKFKWGKNLWIRGCIEVVRESDTSVLSDFMINVLTNVVYIEGNIHSAEEENKKLHKNLATLHSQLEDMIKIKNEMEEVLYKKFILVLNTKKAKIRELQAEINDLKKKIEQSVYDLSTDEEITDQEMQENKIETNPKIVEQQLDDKKSSSSHFKNFYLSSRPSTSKENLEIMKERDFSTPSPRKRPEFEENEFEDIINNIVNLVPSSSKHNADVSKEKIFPRSATIPRKSLKFSEIEESDEDIELKLDTIEKPKLNKTQLNITDEEPEADLFSQSF